MTDGKLRDRLDRASTRIRHYREKLRDQRRKTETALEEVKEAKTEIEAYRASGIRPGVARSSPATVRQSLSSPSYPAQAAIGARGEFIHGRIDSSGNRPAVVVPVIPSATLRRPNAPSQAVVASSSRRTVRRSPLRWIVIGCLVSMILAIFAPAPLVVVSNAKISGEPAILTSPIPGRVSSITAELGREVLAGAVLMHIENPNPDRSALAALESQLASLEATILSLEAARNRRVETPVERSLRLYDAFLGRLGMGPAIEPTVKPSEATRATLEANRTALAEQIAIEKARIAEEAKAYLAAPRDGIVSNITTETVVTPGQRLVDLLPIQTDRITSPVKLREGDVVEVMLPDGSRARGRVAAPTGSTSTLATDDMVVELDRRLPGSWIGKKVDLIVLGRNPGTFTEVLAWWTRSFHL